MTKEKTYPRFTLAQRIEHLTQLVSFTILAVTGLPQKFVTAPWAEGMIVALGGIEQVRIMHRVAATILLLATVYHLVMLGYKLYVTRVKLTMLPALKDAVDAWQVFAHNIGLSKVWPKMGRFTFEEKVEYWAFVWGTVVMAATGFILWNPIATARFLPGEFIPAAKAAHGGEALLAVLSILIWHFYGVHFRRFNKSMWTGKLSEEEMRHEHPLELADIEAGTATRPVDPTDLRQRQRRFLPVASIASVILLAGVAWFVSFEETAIATIPALPTVEAFAPQTPTPIPPTPTPPPVESLTWNGYIGTLFATKCTSCHGEAGGLALTTYADLLAGGANGRVIDASTPAESLILVAQTTGEHPGLLSEIELDRLTQWVVAGAPER